MVDRIFVTYTPTTAPGTYHSTIHYERVDAAGNVIKHVVIEAQPENLDDLSASDKAKGVAEELFRNDGGPSRFGRIDAHVRENAPHDRNIPYEIIAEGDDLSAHLARMQSFADDVNVAGYAYRGDRQNSNSFAGAALRAGELPPATGMAHDPVGPPGELLEFFAPGLNEPLRTPIGPRREAGEVERRGFDKRFGKWGSVAGGGIQPSAAGNSDSFNERFTNWGSVPAARSDESGYPFSRALEEWRLSAAPDGPSSTSVQGALAVTPSDESAFTGRSVEGHDAPSAVSYPQLRRISSGFPGATPPDPDQLLPPERTPALGISSGKPMSLPRLPPSVWGLPDNSKTSGDDALFNFMAGLASRNPTEPAPPPQTDRKPERSLGRRVVGQAPASVFDTGGPAMPFVPSGALLPPNRQEAFGSGEEAVSRMIPQPPSDGSIASILMDRIRTLNERDRRNGQAPFSDAGAPEAPLAPLDGAHFSDFFRSFGAVGGIDPEDTTRQAQPWPDDEEQADLRALEARLSSTGNIRDAVALYKARTASRR